MSNPQAFCAKSFFFARQSTVLDFAMPSNKKDTKKTVKKFMLKTEVKSVPLIDAKEAEASYNLLQKVLSTKQVSFKNILTSCNLSQIQDIANYVKHDKSNVSVKVERLGLYSPELLQLQRLRDALDHAIELGTDMINDAIIRECSTPDGTFDVDGFKSCIDQQLGRLTPS